MFLIILGFLCGLPLMRSHRGYINRLHFLSAIYGLWHIIVNQALSIQKSMFYMYKANYSKATLICRPQCAQNFWISICVLTVSCNTNRFRVRSSIIFWKYFWLKINALGYFLLALCDKSSIGVLTKIFCRMEV